MREEEGSKERKEKRRGGEEVYPCNPHVLGWEEQRSCSCSC